MNNNFDRFRTVLNSAGWLDAQITPLAGDLSTRRYYRLTKGTASVILMDAKSSMEPFVQMTSWLRHHGFTAPEIFAGQPENGILLLEDFGDTSVNHLLSEHPDQTDAIHQGCIDLLMALRRANAPTLPCPDAKKLVAWTEFADLHYPGVDSEGLGAFRDSMTVTLTKVLKHPKSISLRDFHADNLMWLPNRRGHQRLGLLDYQDAFLTHPSYDLVSFLTDARKEITQERRERSLESYIQQSGEDEDEFRQAFAALSAQRNLRILGIIAYGSINGRDHHLGKLPRVHRYFAEALRHPAFETVRDEALASLPDPHVAIEALRK